MTIGLAEMFKSDQRLHSHCASIPLTPSSPPPPPPSLPLSLSPLPRYPSEVVVAGAKSEVDEGVVKRYLTV